MLQVTTWNCARKRRDKVLPVVRSLKSDFVVLQEVARPVEPSPDELWAGTNNKQGLSVISCKGVPIRRAPEYDETQRQALPVEVKGEHPFQLLAVWAMKDPEHYIPNLVAILEHYRAFVARGPTIVAGDFNANPTFDNLHPRHLFRSITEKFEELEFCSAYHASSGEAHGQETQPTLFFRYHQHEPFHIDYLFCPKSWRPALRSVTVGTFEAFAGLSDHRPLSAQFGQEIFDQVHKC